MKTYTKQEIELIAESALDSACLTIQHHLFDDSTNEIQDLFFQGATKDAIKSILESYIRTEINFMQQKAFEEKTRYGIEDLHLSVNDIFEQLDEGYIEQNQAKEILTNCCHAFIKGETV
jgi:hypothetical protein